MSVYDILKKSRAQNGRSVPHVSALLKALDGKDGVALSDDDQALSALLKNVLDMSDNLAQKRIYNRALVFCETSVSYSVQKQNKSKKRKNKRNTEIPLMNGRTIRRICSDPAGVSSPDTRGR